MRILTVNAGSSSLKLRVLDDADVVVCAHEADRDGDLPDQLRRLVDETGPIDAVGHRVVHGGARHVAPELVDDSLVADLEQLVPLAPLHQPAALTGIAAARSALPVVPSIACFDTAFHADLPAAATTYAVPADWRERYGLRRYGAHGLSYAWASRRATAMTNGRRRLVVAHLGSGASLCAILDGRSVDTTMGFTPMEGLVMATRAGSVDPGMLLWLVTEAGMAPQDVADGLDRSGGLVALAGTKEMGDVVRRAASDPDAALALDVYVHRLAAGIGAMTTALGGLDALVFTGGVGERSHVVREAACARLGHLGIALDSNRNRSARPDCQVSGTDSVPVLVVAAREDVSIAQGVRQVLGSS